MSEQNVKTILLVEDEVLIAMQEAKQLEKEGYRVIRAHSGEDAVAMVKKASNTIALILMDINLGAGIDGTQAAQEILKENDIPILFLSSHTEPEVVAKTEKITSYGYVVKSSSPTVLFASIKMAFKLHAAHQALRQANEKLEAEIAERKQTEEALRKSEAKFRAVVENSYDGILFGDVNAKISYRSPSYTRINGYTDEERLGHIGFETVHPDDVEKVRQYWAQVVQNPGLPLTTEYQILHKDGSWRWIESTGNNQTNNPDIGKIVVTSRDITDRKRAEAALQENEARYRALISEMFAGFALHQILCDDAGNPIDYVTLEVNKAFETFLNAPRDVVIGKKASEILLQDELNHWLDIFSPVALTGKPTHYEMYSPLNKKHFEGSAYCPEIGKFAVTFTDVTERKQAEETLRASNAKFQAVAESTPAIIVIIQGSSIVYANPYATNLVGYDNDELCALPFLDLIHPHDRQMIASRIEARFREEHVSHRAEIQIITKSGDIKWIDFSGELIAYEGKPAILATAQDVTEKKQDETILEARLRISKYAETHTLDDLLQNALDEICNLIDSPIGFFHFVEPDQHIISLQAWSTRTILEMCSAEGKGHAYDINQAGVWVDCIRQGKPVIHNNYASLPDRKGLPEGHAPIIREMVFPIMREQKMVAIIGVGNKSQDYTEKDVAYASRLADMIWDITGRKRAEDSLIQSEQKYRSIVESSPIPYAFNDDHQNITQVNSAFIKTFGYTLEDIPTLADWWERAYPNPEYRHWVASTWQSRIEEARLKDVEPDPMEVRICCKNGDERIVLVSAKSLLGSFAGIHLVVLYDITDLKRVEDAVKQNEERLRVAMNAVKVAVFNQDLDLRYTWMYEPQVGYATTTVIAKTDSDLFPQQDALKIIRLKQQALEQGNRVHDEVAIHLPEQTLFYDLIVDPIRNEQGKIIGLVGATLDITARKQAEDDIREAGIRYRELIDSITEPFFALDINLCCVHWNMAAEKLLNIPTEQALGRTFTEIFQEESVNKAAEVFQEVMATQEKKVLLHEFLIGETTRIFEITIFPTPQGVSAFLKDTTLQKQIEAALKQSIQEKDTLLQELQHRVKNSLTVAASLMALEEDNLPDEHSRAIFANTQARLHSMSAVYEQLYRSDGLPYIDLRSYIQSLVSGLSQSYIYEIDQVNIETQLDEIHLDLKHTLPLGIILNELITNAIKYAFPDRRMPPGKEKTIQVELRQIEGQMKLCVVDNGVGLTGDTHLNSGMGLELVKMLAQQMDGQFTIEDRDGFTACVTFAMP